MRIGVIGAYGATGVVVAEELLARTDAELVVGGRDEGRARALAQRLGERASAARVDAGDPDSARAFCQGLDIAVNCAGPSHFLRDRFARAALAAGVHSVDVGGSEIAFSELTRTWREPEERGLAAFVNAGWIPGLTGVLAHLVARRARAELDRVERVELFYGDQSTWSTTGMIDIVELARIFPGFGLYRNGEWVPGTPADVRTALRRVRLPEPYGARFATLAFSTELRELASDPALPEVSSYLVQLLGPRAAAALAVALAFYEKRPEAGAKLVAEALRRDGKPDGGVLAAAAHGTKDGAPRRLSATVLETRNYWITGLVGALVTAMLADGRIEARGCRYACDVVDPEALLSELRAAGVRCHTDW